MSKKKRIALATLPMIALIVLSTSIASAAGPSRFRELTEEQRAALEEARELRRQGDSDGARDVLKDAGLPEDLRIRGKGHGGMMGMSFEERETMRASHEAMRKAVEDNDFDAFKKATLDAPFADMVTRANFDKLVKAHELRQSGDFDGAREILKDLGFPGRGPMMGHGMMGRGGFGS